MNYLPALIQGIKLLDENQNGIEDEGEDTPIPGITINLYADDGDTAGALDINDTLLDSTVTAADGTWSFGDLTPGDYIVAGLRYSCWGPCEGCSLAGQNVSRDVPDRDARDRD
jgi:hypothetical protein